MSKNSTKRKHSIILPIISALIIIVAIVVLAKIYIYDPFKDEAISALTEKLIQTQINSDTTLPDGTTVNAQELLDSMSPEDQDTIHEIVKEHVTPSTISKATSYVTSGDTQGLKEYAKDMLTDSETEELKSLYKKYKDEIPSTLQN